MRKVLNYCARLCSLSWRTPPPHVCKWLQFKNTHARAPDLKFNLLRGGTWLWAGFLHRAWQSCSAAWPASAAFSHSVCRSTSIYLPQGAREHLLSRSCCLLRLSTCLRPEVRNAQLLDTKLLLCSQSICLLWTEIIFFCDLSEISVIMSILKDTTSFIKVL